ncbi:hypothetical protein BUALT_Bualt14G0094700 [Buddleja alternifolia]|uniref:FLZ-type domain-containing protein n=1 Tax=Buddleja alternifolia TaxID=168488 RepID=A0AAV6WTI2_9LAMI|nr:hypothetical protein BUALT_Bualt14G0094700 [Buddleja alternifolia]
MTEKGSLQSSPKINYRQITSSFFMSSPKLFNNFVSKGSNDIEPTMNSPTSILDTKPFSALNLKTPFCSDPNTPLTPKPENKNFLDSKRVRLGLVDALIDSNSDSNSSKMVIFGSQLKIQVPPLPPSVFSPNESPKSPCDFGIKTRNSFSPRLSSSPLRKSSFGSSSSANFSSLSATEMELSEDYTCVISYGPNPRTTHIFDDCIVESCCGVVKFSESKKESEVSSKRSMNCYPSESFLSFCYNCKKNLGQGKDIYMYRGEKAFCSSECRYKEMMLEEEGLESLDYDVYDTSS